MVETSLKSDIHSQLIRKSKKLFKEQYYWIEEMHLENGTHTENLSSFFTSKIIEYKIKK